MFIQTRGVEGRESTSVECLFSMIPRIHRRSEEEEDIQLQSSACSQCSQEAPCQESRHHDLLDLLLGHALHQAHVRAVAPQVEIESNVLKWVIINF